MKYLLFVGVWAVAFVVASPLMAQVATPTNVAENEGTALLVATVNITNANYVQQGNLFTISFDISNRIGVQPGIRYGVILTKKGDRGSLVVHQRAYDEVLTLGENSLQRKQVSYWAPESLSGEFSLALVSESESGLRYAYIPLGTVVLSPAQNESVVIDTATCYLTNKSNGLQHDPTAQAIVNAEETLISHCVVENRGKTEAVVSSMIIQRTGSMFGPLVGLEKMKGEPFTLAAGEKREIITEIPVAKIPQYYEGVLVYGSSNGFYYQYSVVGGSAAIKSVLFDKDLYQVGETALLKVYWTSPAALTAPHIAVIMTDDDGAICADGLRKEFVPQASSVIELSLFITKDCTNPKAEIVIENDEFGLLARQTLFASMPGSSADAQTAPSVITDNTLEHKPFGQTIPFWISVFGLMLGLIFLVHRAWQEKKANAHTTPIAVLFLMFAATFSLLPTEARADTFLIEKTTGPADGRYSYEATIATNKLTYNLGETVQISGILNYEAPSTDRTFDIRYALDGGTATLLDQLSLQGDTSPFLYQATIDGALPAPTAGSHTVRIMGPADSTGYADLPFTVTALAPCAATIINGCSLSDTNHSGSSGSCYALPSDCSTGNPDSSGSCSWSGSCNYTCNDGSWQLVSNACVLGPTAPAIPDLVVDDLWHTEPIDSGGGGTVIDDSLNQKNRFTFKDPLQSIWHILRNVTNKLATVINPPRAHAVAAGTDITLYGAYSNQGTGSTEISFMNQFSYQFNSTSGDWISIPTYSGSNALNAGQSAMDAVLFSIPYTTGTMYVRYCLDIYDEIAESGVDGPYANCKTIEITVTAPVPVQCTESIEAEKTGEPITNDSLQSDGDTLSGDPVSNYDLLMSEPPTVDYSIVAACYSYEERNLTSGISAATETFAGEPTEVRAILLNNGLNNVNASFTNLVQVSDTGSDADAVDAGTVVIDPLIGLAGAIARFNFIFPASAAGTNKFVRVCADKSSADNSGTIAEANELLGENCGPWNSILIKPACPAGETKTWTVGSNTCTATTPVGVKDSLSTLTDSTGSTTGSAQYLCQNNRTWAISPNPGYTCYSATLADLSAANTGPAANADFLSTGSITFTGTANNSNAATITQGGWADVEIDWGSDGSFDSLNAFGGVKLGAFALNESKNLSYTWNSPPIGTHRYRFNVDTLNELLETNETNNRSAWVTFTVSAPLVASFTFTASGYNIAAGDSTNLVWTATNVSSCTATGGWSGAKTQLGDTEAVSPIVSTTYYLECFDSSANTLGTKQVDITVTAVAVNQLPDVDAGMENIIISLPTITASPSGVTVSDPDGTVDSVEWTLETGPSGATILGADSNTPTFTNLDTVGDYIFKLTATDDVGGQNSDTMTVTVTPAPPWAIIGANPTVVSAGGTSQVTWNSEQYSVCSVAGLSGSDSWSGLSGTETTSPINADTTYAVTCDGTPRDSVLIRVSPDVTLTANKYIVRPNEEVEISWNTNGNNEALCTLTQNGLPTTDFLDGDGVGSKTVTLNSRTRFTLSCGAQPSHIDIEMRPTVWNS